MRLLRLNRHQGRHRRARVGTYVRLAAFATSEWWALPAGTQIPPTEVVVIAPADPWCAIPLYRWTRTVDQHVSVLLFMVR